MSISYQFIRTFAALEASLLVVDTLHPRIAGLPTARCRGANAAVAYLTRWTGAAFVATAHNQALNAGVAGFGKTRVLEALPAVADVAARTWPALEAVLAVDAVHTVETGVGLAGVQLAGASVPDHVWRTVAADGRAVKHEALDARVAGNVGAQVATVDAVPTIARWAGSALETGFPIGAADVSVAGAGEAVVLLAYLTIAL